MMMKKLIATLGFILAVAGPSVAMATNTPDLIHNKVCISVLPQIEKCAEVDITYGSQTYACQSITSSGSIVILNKNNNGNMTFQCEASDGGKHNFTIDCKNGQIGSASNVSSYSYTCNYGAQHSGQTFDVACIVDGEEPTNPACIKEIGVDYGLYGLCGNGIIEAGEECDLWNNSNYNGSSMAIGSYLDYYGNIGAGQFANKGYSCKNCKIIGGGNYVYEPAECLYTDTPISIMNNEILPYWWRLWLKEDSQIVANNDYCKNVQYNESDEKGSVNEKTILRKDSMICHFAVYNGNHNQNGNPIKTFSEKCFLDENEDYRIYEYFWQPGSHHSKVDGASLEPIPVATNGHSDEEFGEYKIVLERVEYEYCNKKTKTRTPGNKYGAICEVNFAVTRPYMMQISTFGVNPVATNNKDFLYDFFDMYGDPILNKTDLKSVISTDNASYAVDYRVDNKFDEFSNKYKKLAVEIKSDFVIQTTKGTKTTVGNLFEADKSYKIKKVPNQSIYFIEGNGGTLILSQDKINNLTAAYTIVVEGMDVEIVGNVLQYAMIVTDGTMSFKDAGGDSKLKTSCANGGQVVQGIYVAVGGFEIGEKILNNSKDEYRCPWGGLRVKGVLIGSNVEELMESKRSQLNSWFNASSSSNANRERRQKIIEGAALLIEYSPSLWKTLPPGAEIFTESLEVYRK